MSNSIASLKLTLSAPGPGGSTYTLSKSVLAPFKGAAVDTIDVPAESTDTFSVSFGTVDTAATLVVVLNQTDGDLAVKINGAGTASHNIAAGGVMAFGQDAAPAGAPLLGIDLVAATTEAGSIGTWVFGDPEVET
jgi:hypothetical protein